MSTWFETVTPIALIDPTFFGELVLIAGAVIIGIAEICEAVENSKSESDSKPEETPKSVTEGEKKLPNQGEVSEVPGAPPVDAGKQGKHVPGRNNNIPSKSQWKKGETEQNTWI